VEFDKKASLWNADETFFRYKKFNPKKQEGPSCVATVLSILADEQPAYFQERINTQDPVSWSDALVPFSMKLAYCPTDCRKVMHYANQLLLIDDLFFISYYTPKDPWAILGDPDQDGWVCGSHIVICHRSNIIDPAKGTQTPLLEHKSMNRHTKRIFRIVPESHKRGI